MIEGQTVPGGQVLALDDSEFGAVHGLCRCVQCRCCSEPKLALGLWHSNVLDGSQDSVIAPNPRNSVSAKFKCPYGVFHSSASGLRCYFTVVSRGRHQ